MTEEVPAEELIAWMEERNRKFPPPRATSLLSEATDELEEPPALLFMVPAGSA
jgi:hypothetical protein